MQPPATRPPRPSISGRLPITSVRKVRATCSGSRNRLIQQIATTAAPTATKVENRSASSTFNGMIRKHRLQAPGGPQSAIRIDAVLEPRVNPGLLDLAHQFARTDVLSASASRLTA